MLARQSLRASALSRHIGQGSPVLARADAQVHCMAPSSRGMALASSSRHACSTTSQSRVLGSTHQSVKPMPTSQQKMILFRAQYSHLSRPMLQSAHSPARSNAFAMQTRALSLWPFSSSSSSSSLPPASSQSPSPAPVSQASASTPATLPDVAAAEGHGVNEGVEAATQAATGSADHIVTLSDMAVSSWPNVKAAQYLTDWVVETTGLPWWANIAIVTIGVRILVLPLVLRGQTNAIRLANINPKMQSMMKDMSYAKSAGDQKLMAESAQKVQKLMKDNDCHPMRSLITPLVQAPMFISFFFGLRSFAEQGLTSMKTGGLAWFQDLTVADPNTILPVLSAASMLAVIETGAELGGGAQQNTAQARMTRNVLRGASVIMIPFIWNLPAAVFIYWLTNNTISLVQLLVLQIPFVRKALKIPQRIDHKLDEDGASGPRTKPMSFWDSITAGKDSQTAAHANVRTTNRNAMPSVLQDQRRTDEARERALQRMMHESGVQEKGASTSKPVASSATAAPSRSPTKPVAASTSRAQDRVQAARERRQKRAQR